MLIQPKAIGGLGFRDLCKFNEAILAKQVWRLLYNMDSLFYRVFKAKYLMQNCLRVIYAWKSIFKSQKVITLGSKWRLGDGSLVRIFEDNWIPGNPEGRIISPKLNLPHNATVSHLMDMNSGWWNFMLIDDNFLPFEVQKMKAIPLSSFNQPDHLQILSKQVIGFFVRKPPREMQRVHPLNG